MIEEEGHWGVERERSAWEERRMWWIEMYHYILCLVLFSTMIHGGQARI